MIALLFATEFELGNKTFDWVDFDGLKISYLNQNICIIITGAGIADTALSLISLNNFRQKHESVKIINIGIAGCLNEALDHGAYMPGVFTFNTFSLGESPSEGFVESCYPQVKLYEGPVLVTSAVPVWDKVTKAFLSKSNADFVDMEAYLFAKWAKESSQEFYFVKIISDHASEESKEKFKIGAFKAIESISDGLSSLEALISASKEVDLESIKKCFRVDS